LTDFTSFTLARLAGSRSASPAARIARLRSRIARIVCALQLQRDDAGSTLLAHQAAELLDPAGRRGVRRRLRARCRLDPTDYGTVLAGGQQ
jgi:hypothetical protein